MSETPQRNSLQLGNLDQSIEQEQPSSFKRDSSVGRFDFSAQEQLQQPHFNEQNQSPHFNEQDQSHNMMGDSHFSQDGVFSYNDDYRMRQSMRSEEDCELEDISGNADMTDRHEEKNEEDQLNNEIKIVEQYDGEEEKSLNEESILHHEHSENQHMQNGKQIIHSSEQSQVMHPTLLSVVQQVSRDEVIGENYRSTSSRDNKQGNKTPVRLQSQCNEENQLWSNQSDSAFSPKLELENYHNNNHQQLSTQQITQSTQQSIYKQSLTNEQQSPTKEQQSPLKEQQSPSKEQQSSSKEQQFSNKQSPLKDYTPLKEQSLSKQQSLSKEQPSNKPKITLLKQSLIEIKQPQTSTSTIRDWFKPQTLKLTQQPPTKQYNPNINEIPSPVKQDPKQKHKRQMQQQMKDIQQSLLQPAQKNNKLFGVNDKEKEREKQKEKQRQKINKTHLPQPTSKRLLQSGLQEVNGEDCRMLMRISFEKKKQNYQMLKQWDRRRADNMNAHKSIIQLLQTQIDKRIKASLQNFQIYTNFFREKLRQQQKFTSSPVINTKYALQNNAISKNIYINCSVILNSLSEENVAKCKKVQDFITLIKNNVLKELTEHHLNQSQRELLKVREKISSLKNSLKKYNTETEEKSEQLARLFAESSSSGASIKSGSDFYSVQLEFLRSASQQILIQKRLGENCLEYYETAIKEEFKRAQVIREALLTYSKGLKETYNVELQDVGLEQLSKTQQTKLIQEFYSLDDMFDQRNSYVLKQQFNTPEHQDLTLSHVSAFVGNFQFENFNNRMLLLKEFNAKYYAAGGSKDIRNAREQNCYIVITVDFWVHLFFSGEKTLTLKPDVSLKILAKELEVRSLKEEFIEIVKKQERRGSMISYFWDSKNEKTYRVKFSSKDAKEQFCDYVKKLMF